MKIQKRRAKVKPFEYCVLTHESFAWSDFLNCLRSNVRTLALCYRCPADIGIGYAPVCAPGEGGAGTSADNTTLCSVTQGRTRSTVQKFPPRNQQCRKQNDIQRYLKK